MLTPDSFVPELLSPAGSLKNMRYAFAYGADAVYAGQPRYSLRVRNNEFNHQNLEIGINEAHALGKKFYVVVNIAPHNAKLKTFLRDLQPVIDMGPDALIMSDPGLIMMVREAFPQMDIHLSVQANAVNWATVKFWKQMGLTRVILSRELSLEEIAEIRAQVPDTSTIVTRIMVPAPTPAAGNTKFRKVKRTISAASCISMSRYRCSRSKPCSPLWASVSRRTKCTCWKKRCVQVNT
jgi:collagenase-like PrtC family protease